MSTIPTPRCTPAAFTLMEMAVVLTFLGLSIAVLLGAAGRQLDRMAVVGGREEVAGLFHEVRQVAAARGGAELVVRSDPPAVSLLASGDTLAHADLRKAYGITLELSRGRRQVSLYFGPLGLGRVSSQTIRFQRGASEARLVVSALGRITRR